MLVKNLRLQNFRNYREAEFAFQKTAIALFGKNGSGKTNVLDAIHYLSFTKSLLNSSDSLNVRHGENFFAIEGSFERDGKAHSVLCTYDGKKKIFEDGQECTRFSDHIGVYPVVAIIPQDITLIWEAGEGRRKFFDRWLSQINKKYLESLVAYHHQLKQRNGLLREAQSRGQIDLDLLESYTQELVQQAEFIYSERQKFVSNVNPEFFNVYSGLCNSDEDVAVKYLSHLDEGSMREKLDEYLEREVAAGRTLIGIHFDEFQFLLNGYEVRKTGSQGQQKSFLIGLKMVELSQLTEKWRSPPVVLLDDIFDKMDNDRISKFMELLMERKVGQFLISEANPQRARKIFNLANLDFQEFNAEELALK